MGEAADTGGPGGRGRALLIGGVVLTQLVGLGLAALLWYAGARDAPPLGWPAMLAWLPLVGLWFANRRWHRAWTTRTERPGSPHP